MFRGQALRQDFRQALPQFFLEVRRSALPIYPAIGFDFDSSAAQAVARAFAPSAAWLPAYPEGTPDRASTTA